MRIEIPYGREDVEIYIRDENFGEMVYPNEVDMKNETDTLMDALQNPIQSKSFDDFLSDARDVLFIVNDGTRPTPTAKVLDMLYEKISRYSIRFIVATGVHRGPTEEELQEIFGSHLDEFRDRIVIHDAEKEEDMVSIGVSKNGTEMQVNRLGMEAHKIVIIGSVEPHYFAGYTGGRKAFLPGIASYRTIEQNHKLALKSSAQALTLEGNPVHEDMEDAIQAIKDKEIFSIMTVLDREDRIYAATAGDITESLKAAIEKSHEVFSVEIKEKADIVVAVAPYPMDVDLYQSQKAIDNAKLGLNPNGILILIAKCRSGVGHDTFVRLLSETHNPQDALDRIRKKYVLGYHKAAKIAEIARWANIWAVTSLDPDLMRSIFIKPFRMIQSALDAAVEEKGREKILFMMAASMTVPRLRKRLILKPRRFIHGVQPQPEKSPPDLSLDELKPESIKEKMIVSLMENR
jgi:nickel-dependent lactate racemase